MYILGYFKICSACCKVFTFLLFYSLHIKAGLKKRQPLPSHCSWRKCLWSRASHVCFRAQTAVSSQCSAAVAMAATYFCPSAVGEDSLQSGHSHSLRSSRLRCSAHLLFTLLSVSGVLQFISPMAAGIKFPVTLGRSVL